MRTVRARSAIRGMTLVEVMISMVIAMLMLLGIAGTVLSARGATARGNAYTVASQLVRARLDRALMDPRTSTSIGSISGLRSLTGVTLTELRNVPPTTTNATLRWTVDPEQRRAGDDTSGRYFAIDGTGARDTAREDAFQAQGPVTTATKTCAEIPDGMFCRELLLLPGAAGQTPTPGASPAGQVAVPNGQLMTLWVRVVRGGDPGLAVTGSMVVTR